MRRPVIGTLLPLGLLLISSGPAFANLLDSSSAANAGAITIEDPSLGGVIDIQPIDTVTTLDGYWFYGSSGNVSADPVDANMSNWILPLLIADRQPSAGALEEATGPHALLDSGGTVVTLKGAHDSGAGVAVAIGSSGQIVGNVDDGLRPRKLAPGPQLADVPEPNSWPLLLGGVVALAMVLRRKRQPSS